MHFVYLQPCVSPINARYVGHECIVSKEQKVFKINQFVLSFVVFVLLGELHFAQKGHHKTKCGVVYLCALQHGFVGGGVQVDVGHGLRREVYAVQFAQLAHGMHVFGRQAVGV